MRKKTTPLNRDIFVYGYDADLWASDTALGKAWGTVGRTASYLAIQAAHLQAIEMEMADR
jgi:hypothetical protein